MTFDRTSTVIPASAHIEDREIEVEGDVVIGNRCKLSASVTTESRIFVGERAVIEGDLRAEGEIRIDRWTRIVGDITCAGNVYLADGVKVNGRLYVEGNLDIGSGVDVKEYEAKGWINIRHPIPVIIYILIYLLDLIRRGRGEEVEQILSELEDMEEEIVITPNFLYLPDRSTLDDKGIRAKGLIRLGEDAVVKVGLESTGGSVIVGKEAMVAGEVRSVNTVHLSAGSHIIGDIRAESGVNVGPDVALMGNVYGAFVQVESTARIEGTIIAAEGVKILTPEMKEIEHKIERFEMGLESMDYDLE